MINKNLDKQITMGNVANYVKKRKLQINGGVWDTEKLPVIKIFLGSLFFTFGIVFTFSVGHFLIKLGKTTTQEQFHKRIEVNDVFAWILEKWLFIFIILAIIIFFLLIISAIKYYYTNKPQRFYNLSRVILCTGIVFTLSYYFTAILFIPLTFGIVMRYIFISLGTILYVYFSMRWIRSSIYTFYKVINQSRIETWIKKTIKLIWPLFAVIATISYATAAYTTDIRMSFYSAVSPFFILFLVPLAFITWYYSYEELLQMYYINKFPEAIRFETDFTKEEWYGKNYRKSKEVMRKIQEFEDYINNKEA